MKNIIFFFYNIKFKLDKNKYIQAIRQSLITLLPIFLIGAIALLFQSFPVESIRNIIIKSFDGVLYALLNVIYLITFGFSSIYILLSITYLYYKSISNNKNTQIFVCFNSLICYFILLGVKVLFGEASILEYTGMSNVFSAVLVSFISTSIFHFVVKKIESNKKNKLRFSSSFNSALSSVTPILICIIIFSIISLPIYYLGNHKNFNDLLISLLVYPFEHIGATYFGGLLINLFSSIFWFFGIHGNTIFEEVYRNIFLFEPGKIVTKHFFDCFSLIGGCGTTLSLVISLLIFSKGKRKKHVAKISSIPCLFNISELVVFGIPIILNPLYLIPFIMVPIINYSVSYLFVSSGIVGAIVFNNFQWTTPVLISGFQATNSLSGLLLQFLCLVIGVLVYTPFVMLDNIISEMSADEMNNELTKYIQKCEREYNEPNILSLNNHLSYHAEGILIELEEAIENQNLEIYYQPQVENEKIVSIEALLRFKYKTDIYLYPPLVIELAKEKRIFKSLTKEIVNQVINAAKRVNELDSNIKFSINVDIDLLNDDDFIYWFVDAINRNNIIHDKIGVELTENSRIKNATKFKEIFDFLHKNNIKIYMDDFSMGHTSIVYLQNGSFDYVKIDGSLVKNLHNSRSKDIIESIVNLGNSLNFGVIAEYVETKEVKEELEKIGCKIFQGYYFYRPMDIESLLKVLKNRN